MIERYDKKEISNLWTDTAKFQTYLQVELAIMQAQEECSGGKTIPQGSAEKIKGKVKINPTRVAEIEEQVKHDVIAFCSSITEQLPTELGRYFHYGVTSSDIIDSALSLQIKASLGPILMAFREVLRSLSELAKKYKNLPALGRSHGMSAEPMSFGQKFLGHYAEFYRRYLDLKNFYEKELSVQFSGAVGNYTIVTAKAEERAAQILGLPVEPVSTQVIARDRIAKLIQIGSLTGAAIERLSVEIRHLHRSEVNELHEGFTPGQKGSSIMPHKKNPISGENLTGMARMLRSHSQIALDNVVLWHERDISHSSAERFYLPDHFGILYYALTRMKDTLDRLDIHQEVISERAENEFVYWSSYYLHLLLASNEITREVVYEEIQKAAFDGLKEKSGDVFYKTLVEALKKKGVTTLLPEPGQAQIIKTYLNSVDVVYDRVLRQYPVPLT